MYRKGRVTLKLTVLILGPIIVISFSVPTLAGDTGRYQVARISEGTSFYGIDTAEGHLWYFLMGPGKDSPDWGALYLAVRS